MTPRAKKANREPRFLEWVGLSVLVVFTVTAVLGYWTFGLHPNLIPDNDFSRNFFGLSFKLFARGHILVAGLVLAIKLYRHSDLRWVFGLITVAAVSEPRSAGGERR